MLNRFCCYFRTCDSFYGDGPTSTLDNMAFLSTSWSPVYTMHLAFGHRRCVALIAAHSTRSPPPPALLISLINHPSLYVDSHRRIHTRKGGKSRLSHPIPYPRLYLPSRLLDETGRFPTHHYLFYLSMLPYILFLRFEPIPGFGLFVQQSSSSNSHQLCLQNRIRALDQEV
jgi:hypothetical protein